MSFFARLMSHSLVAAALPAMITTAVGAQTRGQPVTFASADFAKLRWIEGSWTGSAPGQSVTYERYRFVNDSTIEITYYGDSTMTRAMGTGRLYFAVGRIYHSFGSRRWGATRLDKSGVFFAPQDNAHSTFAWSFEGRDTWTSTLRSGGSGRELVTVYSMRRLR